MVGGERHETFHFYSGPQFLANPEGPADLGEESPENQSCPAGRAERPIPARPVAAPRAGEAALYRYHRLMTGPGALAPGTGFR